MIPHFSDDATFQIRFQPFQLDPSMPSTVQKSEYFGKMFGGRGWQREKLAELQNKWAVDGLKLTHPRVAMAEIGGTRSTPSVSSGGHVSRAARTP